MPKTPDTTIDVDAATRTGLRGRLDRMLRDFTTNAQALSITLRLLDEDDRALALERAPQKFLQAMNARNSHAGRVPVEAITRDHKMPRAQRVALLATYLQEHGGSATTKEIATGIGVTPNRVLVLAREVAKPTGGGVSRTPMTWTLKSARAEKPMPRQRGKGKFKKAKKDTRTYAQRKKGTAPIHGKALSLFLLEHLDEQTPKPLTAMLTALADAGSPMKSPQALNGPLNVALIANGYVQRTPDGFQRTPKGFTLAQTLRPLLETQGKIAPGGYTAAA